jgi:SAM-dependent methyltransferase
MAVVEERVRRLLVAGIAFAVFACRSAPAPEPRSAVRSTPVERIWSDAHTLEPLVAAPFTRRFLQAAAALPHVPSRTLYRDADKTHFFTAREVITLPEDRRRSLIPEPVDEEVYYETRYGSPLSYARPLDVLAESGVTLRQGSRVLDFGFGYIGHLRALASLGLDVVGVDVDPMLRALYAERGDQGEIPGSTPPGHVRIEIGKFPSDRSVRDAVGQGFDVVVSKNVLKRGYIHPDRPADPKHLIQLGADDADVLASFYAVVAPGGTMLIYNICPAPSPPDKPFVPWSDGRSPFSEAQWRQAGFDVKIFDRDDTATLRAFARALGWGTGEDPMDLDNDLSVLFTLVRKPSG